MKYIFMILMVGVIGCNVSLSETEALNIITVKGCKTGKLYKAEIVAKILEGSIDERWKIYIPSINENETISPVSYCYNGTEVYLVRLGYKEDEPKGKPNPNDMGGER